MTNSAASQTPAKPPRIAFVGTGAQGASIGADFALAGHDVTFIEQWPAHVEAIRAERHHGQPADAHDQREARRRCTSVRWRKCASRSISIFLVVKAYDTKWVTQMIAPVLADDGFVVGLQNGMTHLDIASVVGPERTIGAVIEIASNMFTPGVTNRQNDHDESWFALGAVDPEQQHRVEAVARAAALRRPRRSVRRHQILQMDEAGRQRRGIDTFGAARSAAQRRRALRLDFSK